LINAFAIKIFIMKPFFTLILFFALCLFFAACKKTQTQSPACQPVQMHDGIVKCNGKFRRPTQGTTYYKNTPREFLTNGKNYNCYLPTYFDSLGNEQSMIPHSVSVTFGWLTYPGNSSAVPGLCDQQALYVKPVTNSGSNWYDSCTGILYLHYNWSYVQSSNVQWEICDTCYF
jgi:hypothetical protein